jgi:Uma2 family endonuclease
MAAERTPFLTPKEYLEIERTATTRSEYLSGQMFAMAGGSKEHARILLNLSGNLWAELRGGNCTAATGDLRVLVSPTELYTYPDLVVYCEAEWLDGDSDTLLNPSAIFEILSPSTETYNRGEKFAHYRRLDSLRDYVLVSQDRIRIEH